MTGCVHVLRYTMLQRNGNYKLDLHMFREIRWLKLYGSKFGNITVASTSEVRAKALLLAFNKYGSIWQFLI